MATWRPFSLAKPSHGRSGFSLVELSVVVIIIAVLSAFGIPRLLRSTEKAKAAEAFKYLTTIRDAQERNSMRNGEYATSLTDLDFAYATPVYFSVGAITAGDTGSIEDSWRLTLTRQGASGGFGAYTVCFDEEGYDPVQSSIELNPDIHPMTR